MIIFTVRLDPDPILFSDPAPLQQIGSDPGGSGSGSTKPAAFFVPRQNFLLLKIINHSEQ
jgi:hypothetical protein